MDNQEKLKQALKNDPKGPYHCFKSFLEKYKKVEVEFTSKKAKKPTSLEFVGKDKEYLLETIFGIPTGDEIFSGKYKEATSGEGNEERRITVLHSSALCSLLFFYNISEDHPLIIKLNGKEEEFCECHFEFENPVIDSANPSSIDVMLLNKDHSIVLFLESKFSEYFHGGRCYEISGDYKKAYEDIGLKFEEKTCSEWQLMSTNKRDGKTCLDRNKNPCLQLAHFTDGKEDSCDHYCGGIKQMISHYIGVKNYIEKVPYTQKQASKQKLQYSDLKDPKIYLGTILFRFEDSQDSKSKPRVCYDQYTKDYSNLIRMLSQDEKKPDCLELVKEPLIYQGVFKDPKWLTQEVKDFYKIYKDNESKKTH
ncbi:MAG: hypothetical protein LKM30_04250 [Bacilli bacterium]|jgi:hypothetical protein|nr:hypothetical protein [Bacilli bacterium]